MQPGHISSAQPSPPVSSVTESAKGPRRRNRAERAALQQEQEVLEQQEAKRSFRCPPQKLLPDILKPQARKQHNVVATCRCSVVMKKFSYSGTWAGAPNVTPQS